MAIWSSAAAVVVPLMHSELVEVNRFMTNQEFLTGFGLVQGRCRGPMFSFSAYAGRHDCPRWQRFYAGHGRCCQRSRRFFTGELLLIYFYAQFGKA